MSTPVTISVIITNYNYRAFVAEAVDGALAQTRAPLQIIVVDDGSTDGSPAYLRERYGCDSRVTLLTGENGGQLAAFVRGLEVAHGDVICFLDADDCWRPDYLAKIGELLDAREDIDFVFSDLELFGDESRRLCYADRAYDLGYTIISTYMLLHWYGTATSALALRAAWARRTLDLPAGFHADWRMSADNCLVFGASVLGAHKYYLPTGCVRYRVHGGNGWWGNRTSTNKYLNRVRSRALIRHYGRVMGLDESCVADAKTEFRTKPEPTRDEARRYAALARLRGGSLWKRLERTTAILWPVWRQRGKLPREQRWLG